MNKLNLDKTLNVNTKRNVVIDKCTYSINFNDDTEKALSSLTITLGAMFDQLNKDTRLFNNEMTVDQRKEYLEKQYKSLQDVVFPVLDKLFKQQGFGEQLFIDYCQKDVETLIKIVNILSAVQAEIELGRINKATQNIIKRGEK